MTARAAAVLLILSVAGCATGRKEEFVTVASRPAMVRWRQGERVFVREAACESAENGAVRMVLGGGARTFLLEPNGRMVTQGWSGPSGAAPPALAPWATLLAIITHADALPEGVREVHTPSERIALVKESGRLQAVAIRSLDAGESLAVTFPRGSATPRDQ